jgi:hypothetical protein
MKSIRALATNNLTVEERQFLRIKASKQYMRGEIDRRQFQEIERKYGIDYGSVTLELASNQKLIPRIFKLLVSFFS